MQLNPDRAYETLVSAGTAWADANAAADLLEETRKSVLAQIMSRCPGDSMAKREMQALGTAEYTEHVAKMVAARQEANRARVRWEAVRVLAGLRQSEEATRRAEMQIR